MKFIPYGPFELPRVNANRLATDSASLKAFWADVEAEVPGLPIGCGCYVFSLKAPRGTKPWYVGKAERTAFRNECLAPHKALIYLSAVAEKKGTPELMLIAQVTPTGKLRNPTNGRRPAISALESMLIGMAVSRNGELVNIQGTKMYRDLEVQGFLNSRRGQSGSPKYLRGMFGI